MTCISSPFQLLGIKEPETHELFAKATAAENDLLLVSGNEKYFKPLPDIKLKVFRPS